MEIIWLDITPQLMAALDQPAFSKAAVNRWVLVLKSQRIRHRIIQTDHGWHLWVEANKVEGAVAQILQYEQENDTPPLPPEPVFESTLSTAFVFFGLAVVYVFSHSSVGLGGLEQWPWFGAGRLQAGLILTGEWWRTATALTLHTDLAHLAGNVFFGGLMIWWFNRRVGVGLGWSLVLLSGMLGNALNAFFQAPTHAAVGASTAVFGAIGLLSSYRAFGPGRTSWKDVAIPIGAGIALLGFLGAGGENTDVGAHLFGFLAGLGLGVGLARGEQTWGLPNPLTQRILGAGAFVLVVLTWSIAFLYTR